jgi:hypothetical protein
MKGDGIADRTTTQSSAVRPVRGHASNVEAVIAVLKKHGVEITDDGVRLIGKPKGRRDSVAAASGTCPCALT